MYSGALGGLAGADALCQARASAAGLTGTFMAWIATAAGSPATRFTRAAVPYVLVNGTVIANNWADLTDGTLAAPIDRTELNGAPPTGNTSCAGGGNRTVWSGVNGSGAYSGSDSCSGFSSTSGGGLWGWLDRSDISWTQWCSGGLCSWVSPLYCFQQ
jgi:hypothetical protein